MSQKHFWELFGEILSKRMNPLSQDARTISLGLEPWWTATEVVFDSDAICNSVHLVKLF